MGRGGKIEKNLSGKSLHWIFKKIALRAQVFMLLFFISIFIIHLRVILGNSAMDSQIFPLRGARDVGLEEEKKKS